MGRLHFYWNFRSPVSYLGPEVEETSLALFSISDLASNVSEMPLATKPHAHFLPQHRIGLVRRVV